MDLVTAVKLAKKRKAEIGNPGWTNSTVADHDALIALLEFAERQHKELEEWQGAYMTCDATAAMLIEARAAGIGD